METLSVTVPGEGTVFEAGFGSELQSFDHLAVQFTGLVITDNAASTSASSCNVLAQYLVAATSYAESEHSNCLAELSCLVRDRISVTHLSISEDKNSFLSCISSVKVLSHFKRFQDISAAQIGTHPIYIFECMLHRTFTVLGHFVLEELLPRAKAEDLKGAPCRQTPDENFEGRLGGFNPCSSHATAAIDQKDKAEFVSRPDEAATIRLLVKLDVDVLRLSTHMLKSGYHGDQTTDFVCRRDLSV